jgi:hypothetical protein
LKTFFSICFWSWGTIGFLICTGNYMTLHGSVGVGTSTYMALGFLYWLGGMMLFGLSALLVRDMPGAPEVLTSPNLQPVAAEAPFDVSPPVPDERKIEHSVEEPRNTEPPENDPPIKDQNIQVAPHLERVALFIVIFLLTLAVAYALLVRK